MTRNTVLVFCISLVSLAMASMFMSVAAYQESLSYNLKSSAFGGIEALPSIAGDYSLIAASDPNAQQPLSGGNYSLASAHPGLLSRVPGAQWPDEEQPDEEEPDDEQPNDEQPSDERPQEEQPDEEQPSEQQPDVETSGTLFIPAVER